MHAGGYFDVLGVTTGEQDGQGGAQFTCLAGQFTPRHARQAVVGHHQVDILALIPENLQRRLAVVSLQHTEFQLLQNIDDEHAHDVVVFYYKDGGRWGGHRDSSQEMKSERRPVENAGLLHE